MRFQPWLSRNSFFERKVRLGSDIEKIAIIEKLKSLGHTHSEGILREGLIYVGVPVACENKQARQKLLKELNQAFGIDSWVKKI